MSLNIHTAKCLHDVSYRRDVLSHFWKRHETRFITIYEVDDSTEYKKVDHFK